MCRDCKTGHKLGAENCPLYKEASAKIAGKKPDRIVIDDPGYDPTASSSWIQNVPERLKSGPDVVIMSRLHEADIATNVTFSSTAFSPLRLPFDRNAYQRDYMRKWRIKQKESK